MVFVLKTLFNKKRKTLPIDPLYNTNILLKQAKILPQNIIKFCEVQSDRLAYNNQRKSPRATAT